MAMSMLNKSTLLSASIFLFLLVGVVRGNELFTSKMGAEFEFGLYDSVLSRKSFLQSEVDTLVYVQTLFAVGNLTDVTEFVNQSNNPLSNLVVAKSYASLFNADSACEYLQKALGLGVDVSRADLLLDTSLVKISDSNCWKEVWQTQWFSDDQTRLQHLLYKVANEEFSEVIDLLYEDNTDFPEKKMLFALAYQGLGQGKDALNVLNSVSTLEEVLLKYDILMDLGYYSKALKLLQSKSDESFQFKKRKAKCLFALKKYEESKKILEEYLTVYYMDSEMLALQAKNFHLLGEYLLGLKLSNQALFYKSSNAFALKLRGDIFFKLREWNLAVKSYQKCLDFTGKDVDAIEKLALSLIELDKKDEACKELQYAKLYGSDKAVELLLYHCRK